MATRRPTRNRKKRRPASPQRTRIVWGVLVASMTLAGGLMSLLSGGAAPRLDGHSLSALVSAEGPSSIETVVRTRAALDRARWDSIVIHHSGSPVGSATTIEAQHKQMNLAGLGYHFVLGNGRGMEDGEVHVGYRWLDQLPGAHVAGPAGDQLNRHSIGICLVGDGRRRPFTQVQVHRLAQLAGTLVRELGIPQDRIFLHSEVAATEDPGRFFPEAEFREELASVR